MPYVDSESIKESIPVAEAIPAADSVPVEDSVPDAVVDEVSVPVVVDPVSDPTPLEAEVTSVE